MTEAATPSETTTPSAAFQPLSNDIRTQVLTTLLDEDQGPRRLSFSELAAGSGTETTAGFAYHLRQLTDQYIRETESEQAGYTLTDAGLRMARAIESGAYTDSIDRDPVVIDDPCPFCEETALIGSARDNTVSVACESCERTLLSLSLPPGGHRSHTDEAFPAALDRLYRHRVSLMSSGSCPECGGRATAQVDYANAEENAERSQLHLDCTVCGYSLRCPVTLAVVDHPAVVAFYHAHGIDIRERPIWNVGQEWRESILSDQPWCVRVSTAIEHDSLELLVGEDATVVETSEF